MRNGLIVMALGYLLLLVETSLGPGIQYGAVRPDGLAALVVWYGRQHPLPLGLLPILGLGILTEPFTELPGGLYILAYASGYLVVRYVICHVMDPVFWQQMLLVFFVSAGVLVIVLTGSGQPDLVWPWGLAQACLNGLTCPVFFYFFHRFWAFPLWAQADYQERGTS